MGANADWSLAGYVSPGAIEERPWPQGGGIALKVRAPPNPD